MMGTTSVRRFARRALFRWRARGWADISRKRYQAIFAELGGSIEVHPLVVDLVADLGGVPVRYLELSRRGVSVAAIPVVDTLLPAVHFTLEHLGLAGRLDLGDGELILPIRAGTNLRVPCALDMVSPLHAGEIVGITPSATVRHMIARRDGDGGPMQQNSRRAMRRFVARGGVIRSVGEFAPTDVARMYIELFAGRWGRRPRGADDLPMIFTRLRPLLRGTVLLMDGEPCALNVAYASVSARALVAVGVNGGWSKAYERLSVGRIMLHALGLALAEEAAALQRPLRYSFGRNDAPYKEDWCVPDVMWQSRRSA